jgi:hypothetical protein
MLRFAFVPLCLLVLLFSAAVSVASVSHISDFVGSDLRYRVGFLWLDHVADGAFSLIRGNEPNVFQARLVGKTRGVTAWLTNDRVQTYETRMRLLPDGRLQTLYHESSIDKGSGKKKKNRRKTYRFDPVNRQVLIEKVGDGKVMWSKSIAVEGDIFPVDILTAFFNFVTGVYGPVETGRHYDIVAFSGEGVGTIRIDVLPPNKAPESFLAGGGLLCRAQVDQEIFDTRDGVIYFKLDSVRRPSRGLIVDIIGLGDIRGIMR